MNLVIDIGNSSAKAAVFSGTDELFSFTVPHLTVGTLQRQLGQYLGELDRAILSTTRHPDVELESFIENVTKRLIRFTAQTPAPIGDAYKTPQTLGADRLAAAVGAWGLADSGKELLIVDFGSAITIDRVSAEGFYLGGNISPGMAMRFRALHELTDRLPLIPYAEIEKEAYGLTGWDTRSAIVGGVVQGISCEIAGYIDRISAEKEGISLFFTGRDAKFFADKLKKTIFVVHDLVIKGLNRILEYNTRHEEKQ